MDSTDDDDSNSVPAVTSKLETMIKDVLEFHLRKTRYRSDVCSRLANELSDTLRERAKEILQDHGRHRVIVQVFIGQDSDESVHLATRCLCSKMTDKCIAGSFRNASLYAVGIVCGFLTEQKERD